MGLFGSVKVAPGVRLSLSPRGMRAHVGPRAARMHVGGGRTGVSTGAGPFTLYSGLVTPERRRPSSSSASGLTPAQAEKARQVQELADAWHELARMHRVRFPEATHPGAVPADPVPMFGVLLRDAERRLLKGVARFDRAARDQARARARAEAEQHALRLLTDGLRDRAERRDAADRTWTALESGQSDAMVVVVSDVLEQRGLDVAVTSDGTGHLRLDLQVPGPDAIPTHQPGVTPKGHSTLKKLTKTEVAQHVRQLVAARVLLAAKEALAQAPGARVVDVFAKRGGDALLRAHLERARLHAADWSSTAWEVLNAIDPEVETNIGGRTQELRPLR